MHPINQGARMSIFDTDDLSDLPPELIGQLRLAGDIDKVLLELFYEADGTLDLSSLLVGYYRKHKEIKTRQYMMMTCYRLVKKGFLVQTGGKGEYKITDRGCAVIGKVNIEEKNDLKNDLSDLI